MSSISHLEKQNLNFYQSLSLSFRFTYSLMEIRNLIGGQSIGKQTRVRQDFSSSSRI